MSNWAKYVAVSERQAYALDKMAAAHGLPDGAALLAEVGDVTRSKLSKLTASQLRQIIDRAFAEYGA